VAKRVSAFVKWIDPLMSIISYKCNSGNPHPHNLRTKLLAFHILEALLPACSDPVVMKQVRKKVLFLLLVLFTWHWMIGSWLIPTNKHFIFVLFQIVEQLFSLLSKYMWEEPVAQRKKLEKERTSDNINRVFDICIAHILHTCICVHWFL